MQTILVPLDGSTLAEQAMPFVQLLAPLLRARVVLLRVEPDPEHEFPITSDPAMASPPENERSARWAQQQYQRWLAYREHHEQYLAALAAPLRAAGLEVELEVELGLPATSIRHVAERWGASLVALASHGYGRLRRWAAGSVAEQVIEQSHIPVLLICAQMRASARLGRILAALDGSVLAPAVLAHALALAHSTGAELVALQAVASSIEEYLGSSGAPSARRAQLHEHVLQAYATHFGAEQAAQARIGVAIGLGNPADAVIEEAARRPPDLIVLGMPRHGSAQRRGGVPIERVAQAVAAPLLLVPASA